MYLIVYITKPYLQCNFIRCNFTLVNIRNPISWLCHLLSLCFSSFHDPLQNFYHFIANFSKLSCANIVLLLYARDRLCYTIPFNQSKWNRNWVAASESNWVNKVDVHIQIPVALMLLLFGCVYRHASVKFKCLYCTMCTHRHRQCILCTHIQIYNIFWLNCISYEVEIYISKRRQQHQQRRTTFMRNITTMSISINLKFRYLHFSVVFPSKREI